MNIEINDKISDKFEELITDLGFDKSKVVEGCFCIGSILKFYFIIHGKCSSCEKDKKFHSQVEKIKTYTNFTENTSVT
jgi:uncharacterized protein YqkB